ncbi:MAG: hypothetical protein A3B04_03675 [Candidatus Portnoybacteria bacterium RIFCSPLOWO2_02_FULL_39_11]|uniref:Uncharacterized protein n=1 Tax=Candidatus Portnoybacteria bacterium RIFCSPLOWO2_02_FULL_39_11 TaxID=1802001 RepID=A0A1G2FUI7_9BACT|nr:MAG: hypothetical protein A3B04_03675 [Candidatus Portnoybacteria bacterium RIFCSPLOWO2_02_FULL_39_11]
MPKLKTDARVDGQIAGSARRQIEQRIGRSIVSKQNFLQNENPQELRASRAAISVGKGKVLKSLKKLR